MLGVKTGLMLSLLPIHLASFHSASGESTCETRSLWSFLFDLAISFAFHRLAFWCSCLLSSSCWACHLLLALLAFLIAAEASLLYVRCVYALFTRTRGVAKSIAWVRVVAMCSVYASSYAYVWSGGFWQGFVPRISAASPYPSLRSFSLSRPAVVAL